MIAVILNIAILDSAILVFPFKLTHTCQDWFPPFAQKNPSLIHSDSTWWWQPSWTLPCWIQTLPFWIQTPCYLLSDSLQTTLPPLWPWLKLILSHLTSWWQPSWILPSWIQPSQSFLSNSLTLAKIGSHSLHLKKPWLIDSDSTWWWQSSWTLPSWILTPCFLLSDSLQNTLSLHSDSDSN